LIALNVYVIKNAMRKINKLEWNILDSLSDDQECFATMYIPRISKTKIKEIVYGLYQEGFLYEDTNQTVDYSTLMSETENYADAHYWFGLTQLGAESWEKYAKTYSGNNIDWSHAWRGHVDYKEKNGYIDGVSKEVCFNALKMVLTEKNWQIDIETIQHSKIDGFQAKYYKYIPGGHRITFTITQSSGD
jgi:hypothetical protein